MHSIAEQIARKAHEGQVEKWGGHPYVQHLERVVALVDSPEAKEVAWLHDVLEDSDLTHRDLEKAGIAPAIADAVLLLTRGSETYAEYIETLRAKRNLLALVVKIADLQDHLRDETLDRLPVSMRRRYERALHTLMRVPTKRSQRGQKMESLVPRFDKSFG